MADIFATGYSSPNSFAAEMGNAAVYSMEHLAATGNAADKIYMGILPAGVRVDLVRLNCGDTGVGNTLSVGYEPVDTLPVAALTYWFSALDTATAAVNTFSSAASIQFDRPVKVVVTVNTAALAGTPNIRLNFVGDMVGAK